MAIGERIHFFRTKRGMTQKYVGNQIGFDENLLMYVWLNMKVKRVSQRIIS